MIQDCVWQICADQFTGNEFYPKKRAFCKWYVGQIAMLETDIRKVSSFQFTVVELSMAESAIGDTFIRTIHWFFHLFAETYPSDSFFGPKPFLEWFGTLDLTFKSGGDDPYGRHAEGFACSHDCCFKRSSLRYFRPILQIFPTRYLIRYIGRIIRKILV